MTARYSHLSPGFMAKAVNRLDGTFELCHQYVTVPKGLPEAIAAGD